MNDDREHPGGAARAAARERAWNQRTFVVTGALLSGLALPISGLADHAAGGPQAPKPAGPPCTPRSARSSSASASGTPPSTAGPCCAICAPASRRTPGRAGRCSLRWCSSAASRRSRSPTRWSAGERSVRHARRALEDPRASASRRDGDTLRGSRPLPLRGLLVLRGGLPRSRARQGGVLPPPARSGRGRRALHRMRQVRQGLQVRSAHRWRRLNYLGPDTASRWA